MEATTAVLAAQQHHVDGFVLGLSKKPFESAKKNTSIRLRHKVRQRLSQQFKSSATHHFEKGVIILKDDAAGIQAQITDRRLLVKSRVPISYCFHLALDPAKFLVLNLQLDLMHGKLVNQPPRLLLRKRGEFLGKVDKKRFGPPPQGFAGENLVALIVH